MKIRLIVITLLLAGACLLTACRSGQIMEQLRGTAVGTENAPGSVVPTGVPGSVAPTGVPGGTVAGVPAVGATTAGGAVVTGAAADGSMYYASIYTPAGTVASELVYAGDTQRLLFRTDYTYDAGGAVATKNALATADKAFAYVGQTDGQTTACRSVYTEYTDGRETYVFYRDFADREVALTLTGYDADGTTVRRFYEYGRLVYVRTYAADGTLLFSSETGGLAVGAIVNLGGGMGDGTVTAIGADGGVTVRFDNRSHRLTDGTEYAGLSLYLVLNSEYRPTVFYYMNGEAKLAQYEVTYAPDRSYVQTCYEQGKLVCTLAYDSADRLLSVTDAAGNAYDAEKPSVGQVIGDGLVCQVNDDGSFVVVFTNKVYKTLGGKTLEGITLYSFYTADRKLAGNKYYYGATCIAEYDVYRNADGSYKVNIFEGESLTATVEYDRDGKAIRMLDAQGNIIHNS